MRGKVNQAKSDGDLYDYKQLLGATDKSKRLNVDNLFRRIKNEKNKDKKLNLLIFSGATFVVLVFLLLLSL